MGRLIVIITYDGPGYVLWKKTDEWRLEQITKVENDVCQRLPLRSCEVNGDLVTIFCHPGGREDTQRKVTTDWVNHLLNSATLSSYSEVYIVSHKERVGWNNISDSRLKGRADFDHWGDQTGRDSVYDAILDLLSEPSAEKVDALIETVKKPAQHLSILKHRIAYVFLPLDIDLRGIAEVTTHGLPDKERDYLKDVLDDKDRHFFHTKLEKLWYMVAHRFAADATSALLADNKAVLEIVSESGKKDDWEIKKGCKKLLKIIGLDCNDDDPYDKGQIEVSPNSSILQFMRYLDLLIEKCAENKIQDDDAKNLLDKEKQLFEPLNQELNGKSLTVGGETQIKDFHTWFCTLDACLSILRERIQSSRKA